VGAQIRRLRFEDGFTFDAFVEETGLGRGYISELERGLVVPTLTSLDRVAVALEVTVADLVVGEDPRERLFDVARRLPPVEVRRLLRSAEATARRLMPAGEAASTAGVGRPGVAAASAAGPRARPVSAAEAKVAYPTRLARKAPRRT
jgi:transcriptional regulator with XRE-family HTH domain